MTVVKEELSMVAETETYKEGQLRKDLEDVEVSTRRVEEHLRRTAEELGAEVDAIVGDPREPRRRVGEVRVLVCGSRGYGPLRSVLLGACRGASWPRRAAR